MIANKNLLEVLQRSVTKERKQADVRENTTLDVKLDEGGDGIQRSLLSQDDTAKSIVVIDFPFLDVMVLGRSGNTMTDEIRAMLKVSGSCCS